MPHCSDKTAHTSHVVTDFTITDTNGIPQSWHCDGIPFARIEYCDTVSHTHSQHPYNTSDGRCLCPGTTDRGAAHPDAIAGKLSIRQLMDGLHARMDLMVERLDGMSDAYDDTIRILDKLTSQFD